MLSSSSPSGGETAAGLLPSWLWDPAAGRIVSANRAALVFWDESSVLALAERTFSPDEPFLAIARRVCDASVAETAVLRFFGARMHGPFACRLSPARLAQGGAGVRMALEPAARQPAPFDAMAHRIMEALERLPIPVLIARASGAVLAANAAAAQAFGATGATLIERLGAAPAQKVQDGLAATGHVSRTIRVEGRGPWHVEARRQRDPVDGTPLDLVVLRNLTGVIAAEAQLGAWAKKARALLDSAEEALLAVDADGRVQLVNRAATRLFERPRERLIGASLTTLLGKAERARLAAATAPVEIELRAAGTTRRVRVDFRPLAAPGVVGLAFTEVRGQPDAEAVLRRALAASEASNRKKSEFLAKVSHELRTPLNAIIGFAEIMRDERMGTLGNARYASYVRDIHHSGQLLLSMINDLLDLSKIESGYADLRRKPVDAASVIQRVVSLLRPAAANASVSLAAHVTPGLTAVVADERSLEQILLNLVSNAVKFTEPGGRVLVTAEADARGGVTLGVRDTGVGMSPAELKVALEPFRRVERVGGLDRPGTGLGLPLAKAMAEANSAEFRIASAPKAGTSIEIRFPRERLAAL